MTKADQSHERAFRERVKAKQLGPQVESMRAELGFSQVMLASRLGISFVSVSRWERGHLVPTGLHDATLRLLRDAILHSGGKKVARALDACSHDQAEVLRALVRLGGDR